MSGAADKVTVFRDTEKGTKEGLTEEIRSGFSGIEGVRRRRTLWAADG